MLAVNQLAGFGAAAKAPAGLTTLTQVLSATDNAGAAFTLPVGIQAGDLIVVWDIAFSGSLPTTVVPAGFTSISNISLTSTRSILSYKIADGGESGAVMNGMDGTLGEAKLVYVFRGDVPITAATPTDINGELTNGNPAAQVVNASGALTPLVVFAAYSVGGLNVDPRTFTPAKDGEINVTDFFVGAGDAWLAYKIYNAAPADVTVDMDDEGDGNGLVSCYIACS